VRRAPLLLLLLLARLAAQGDEAVALPPFLVEAQIKGRPWRHGEAMGFEILSRCPDGTTRRVVEAHHRLHELLGEVLPPSLRWHSAVPRSLILFDEELQPASSQEVVRRLLQPVPGVAADEPPAPGPRGLRLPDPARRFNFLPNLRLWDRDALAIFMIVRRDDFEADRLSLTLDYVRFLVTQRAPALPGWFVAGFLTLYQRVAFEDGELVFPALEWTFPPAAAGAPAVAAIEDLVLPRLPPTADPAAVAARRRWLAEAALFVRWGLEADRGAHRAGLWRLAERGALEGYSPELFRECLGLEPAQARERLAAYLPRAISQPARFAPPRWTRLPAFPLADASELDVARLKGDWERLEVPYVREISPALAPRYLEQARRTLRRAYDRGVRDARLLEVMALCELDAGAEEAGAELLESAATLGRLRPRAAAELGRVRLAARRREAEGGRLDADTLATVLEPLFAARALAPPLVEVYERIGEAWAAAAVRPTRGHLAVLLEGVRLFPRQTALVLRAAELHLEHGYPEEGASLLDAAERLTEEPATRARIAALRAGIPAAR
jgi:phage tail protein X